MATIPHQRSIQPTPKSSSVFPDASALEHERGDFACKKLAVEIEDTIPVVRLSKARQSLRAQFGFSVTKRLTERSVNAEPRPIETDLCDADSGVEEDVLKLLFNPVRVPASRCRLVPSALMSMPPFGI